MDNTLDIEMDQGSSLSYTFNLKNEDKTPFNLTDFEARLQVRQSYGATSTLINCTLANGRLVLTNPLLGMLTLSLAPEDTASVRFVAKDDATLEGVYDLEIISPSSKVYKPAKGSLTLNREVTR